MTKAFRTQFVSLFVAFVGVPIVPSLAQSTPAPSIPQSNAGVQAPGGDRLSPSELEELLGPIALYPDPLLANVLAAAVYPAEVAEAATFVANGGTSELIDAKKWEDPVKAVAKIPDAIKMMGQYKEWTVALGQAYLLQAKDVMEVVQALRKKAQASGALQTSPQQQVVVEQEVVYIKPSDPEIIYVPSYNPSVVYVDDDDDEIVAGVIGFGVGVATGLILANNLDCDWHGGCISYGWHGGYHGGYHGGTYGGNYRGGHNEVNIEGDVNINRNSNNTNVSGNRAGNTANVGNRVGNEGNAWAPNTSKSLATSQANQLSQYKGGNNTAVNRPSVPGRDVARNPAGAPMRTSPRSSELRSVGSPPAGARPGSYSGAPAGASRLPQTPPRQPPPRQPTPSAFNGGSQTRADSQRGASSRSHANRSYSGGGGARSAPSRSRGRR